MKFLLYSLACTLLFVSCNNDYYTMDDFKSVEKIDSHIHIRTENSAYAEQANDDKFLLINVSVDAPGNIGLAAQERFSLAQVKLNPERIKYITAFNLQEWDSANWADKTIAKLKQSFEYGALGIKIWKNIGMVYKDSSGQFIMVDNPRFDPVIQYIIDQDKTVLGHLGEPKNCWLPLDQMTVNNDREYFKNHPEYHMYLHPDYPSYDDQINARDRFLERHPDIRFVGAHLGSLEWDVDELAKRLDKFPYMAVDMAARIPQLQHQTMLDREKVRNFMIKYQDRLIYGTDLGFSDTNNPEAAKKDLHNVWMAHWRYFVTDEKMTASEVNGEFKGLQLPKEVINKIYRTNALKWFKI